MSSPMLFKLVRDQDVSGVPGGRGGDPVRAGILVAAALVLTGCGGYSATPPGEVVDVGLRWVEVRQDDGSVVRYDTDKQVPRRCDEGDRWPECSRGPFAGEVR